MSNQYFQFKQFTVQQERCAMKVSTDACIQGAWTPVAEHVKTLLDIGTGTGLLCLMMAQRDQQISIDAVELDEQAATQAKENVASSPWAERINVVQSDIKAYTFSDPYDMVICNPPFFNNSLLGDNTERNNARHTISLSYNDLLHVLGNVLSDDGYASILLPYTEHEAWSQLLKQNRWQIHRRLFIKPKADALPNRVVSLCSRAMPEEVVDEQLVIYAGPGQYTVQATDLLSPFYLKL